MIGAICLDIHVDTFTHEKRDEWTLCFGFTNFRGHSKDSMILFKDKLIESGIKCGM